MGHLRRDSSKAFRTAGLDDDLWSTLAQCTFGLAPL